MGIRNGAWCLGILVFSPSGITGIYANEQYGKHRSAILALHLIDDSYVPDVHEPMSFVVGVLIIGTRVSDVDDIDDSLS